MEVRVGFEPTVLGICNPLHWTTLPPHYKNKTYINTPYSAFSVQGLQEPPYILSEFHRFHDGCVYICSASPGGNCSTSRHDAIMPITRTFHPLPDRDRYRIASGLWVRRLPPVVVTLLLIVWVTLSGDTRNVLAEHVGIEPTHHLRSDRLAICCLNRSANAPCSCLLPIPGTTGRNRTGTPFGERF